jgi:hypothetical protein
MKLSKMLDALEDRTYAQMLTLCDRKITLEKYNKLKIIRNAAARGRIDADQKGA